MRALFLSAIATLSIIAPGALSQARANSEPLLGQVNFFPYNFCPRGWGAADGSLYKIAENTALFALLGTTYGGDGRETFGVPDFRADKSKKFGHGKWCIALQGTFPSRT